MKTVFKSTTLTETAMIWYLKYRCPMWWTRTSRIASPMTWSTPKNAVQGSSICDIPRNHLCSSRWLPIQHLVYSYSKCNDRSAILNIRQYTRNNHDFWYGNWAPKSTFRDSKGNPKVDLAVTWISTSKSITESSHKIFHRYLCRIEFFKCALFDRSFHK